MKYINKSVSYFVPHYGTLWHKYTQIHYQKCAKSWHGVIGVNELILVIGLEGVIGVNGEY